MLFVDGAEGAQTAAKIADPASKYWVTVESRLREVEAAVAQVQPVWMKEADAMPKEDFPVEPKRMQEELVRVRHILHNKFPNLKIAYLSSRSSITIRRKGRYNRRGFAWGPY